MEIFFLRRGDWWNWASMEPPEQTDGNPVCGGGINDAASASMEPPEQTDGNLASVILSKSVERLQWSHQNKLMEIIDRLRDWLKAAASMEPPEQTDGNLLKSPTF